MPLNLTDLLKKAESKGLTQKVTQQSPSPMLRTWQQESVLYIDNKLEPNLSQSEAKVEPKLEPNLSQSEAKVKPKLSQSSIKLEPKLEPNLSQTRAKLEPKLSQTRAKLEPNLTFFVLTGLQRKIVLLVHEICLTIFEQQTNPLSIEMIAAQCQSPKSAVRKAIQRLEQKGMLIRTEFKNGRGGWTRYQLPDQIYQEILRVKNQKLEPNLSQSWAKLEPNLSQTRAKLEPQLEPQLRPNPSSSSSASDINTTTTRGDEWNFDISLYARFGFTEAHIKQLISRASISAFEVEQSLIEFSYDLDSNQLPSIKTSKINFLMGLFRAGHSYVSEGYKNEQERTISEMARRAEDKRNKRLEEEFIAWESSLTDEERNQIESKLPPHLMTLNCAFGINNAEIKNWLFHYYLEAKS